MDEAKPAEATQVSAVFWIEGEDEPAHDFAQSTIAALQDVIQQGNARDPTVQITIKTIVEDTDEEEDEPLPDQPAPPTTWLMRLKRWFATRWSR
jgi:hypothetical protein